MPFYFMYKGQKVDIPDFEVLAKKPSWNPRLYQPMVYNQEIIEKAERLRPGTLQYDDFWAEMDYYCYNGFQPKGMPRISGRHFYYLNFCNIERLLPGDKLKTLGPPFYRDLDHYLFLELEAAIKNGYGLVITKPRRVGLSEWGSVNSNYNLTFYSRNKIGICAGKDDKAQEFTEKLESSLDHVHPAYRNGKILNNDDIIFLGYRNRINKQTVNCGIQSLARIKTMYADSKAFEGGSYSMVIFEEAGLFDNLTQSYQATKPCFMDGSRQFGIPLIYGTGGDMEKGARGFKVIWDHPETYNVKKIFIPAYFYYPGDGQENEKGEKVTFFNYRTGVTNRKAAKEHILKERKIASKSKETYTQHVQQYPITEEEVFLKSKGGLLDIIKLNFQLKKIDSGGAPEPVLQGRLEWVDNPETTRVLQRALTLKEKTKIRIARGSEVKFVIDEDGYMFKDASPINPNMQYLDYKPDIGGCDSYDEEVDYESSQVSAGAIMAYRCFSGPSRVYNKPVGFIRQRGDASFDDDVFYENCVKFAVYWDLEVLFEYTKFHIMRYFYDVGAEQYVRQRPMIEEANTQNHRNKDGLKMTTVVKNVGTKLLKSEVRNDIHKNFFREVILDLMNYGDENTDIAMAYMMCLFHRMDIFDEVTENIEIGTVNDYGSSEIPEYYYVDMDGNLRVGGFHQNNAPVNGLGIKKTNMEVFHPERDLNKQQYEEYVKNKNAPYEEIKKEQEEFEKEAERIGVDPLMLNVIFQERDRIFKSKPDN